ncbi:DUF2975 domain-containing protein [Photobacterium ganghwense]|uniref:DUF2975 domain-containing protein n=1 Tax=Photobacterium ganghwense TaxID=320778 RepID=UPI004057BA21
MNKLNDIKSISTKMLIILWVMIILNPVFHILLWLFGTFTPNEEFCTTLLVDSSNPSIPVLIISSLSLSVSTLIIWETIKLFKLYSIGEMFTIKNVERYKNLANYLIMYVFVSYFESILISVYLSYTIDDTTISVTFEGIDIALLVVGVIIKIIAKVMSKATEIHEEQLFTI